MRFNAKVSTIEEMIDLDKLIVNKLHSILTTYEMKMNTKYSSKKETTFKASKKSKQKVQVSSDSPDDNSNSEEPLFMRKLKRGFGKYKSKLPLKCFNCGKVGHFEPNVHMRIMKITVMKRSPSLAKRKTMERKR